VAFFIASPYNNHMQEFVTNAIVLRKYPQGDIDGRYTLFTERFGKLMAKAKSSRKIISKLAPHLEPGTLLKVRFIEAHGTQIIDALKDDAIALSLLDMHFLSMLLPDGQPEPELWSMLVEQAQTQQNNRKHERAKFSWSHALAILGWDPEGALCITCNARPGTHFYVPRQEFFCDTCVKKLPSKLRQSAVISLYAAV
jgi:recombinational DNA repair protein (RecF pathway)